MAVTYSVIIPAFNRAPQLRLALAAFDRQTHPASDFELVIIDDGSTDNTPAVVRTHKSKYPIVYVRRDKSKGRSSARNEGIRRANGKYVIFCDADFLVLPHFVSAHANLLRRYPRTVISGAPHIWKSIFTHVYPGFSKHERGTAFSVLNPQGLWRNEYWSTKTIRPVITARDVLTNMPRVRRAVAPWDMAPHIKRQYTMTDVAPWMLFITRCVSVEKALLKEVGGFDERLWRYGLEDWELGYRLHKRGVKFRSVPRLLGYHQEHPSGYRNSSGNLENLRIMYRKHGYKDPELTLIARKPPWVDTVAYKQTLRKLQKKNIKTEAQKRAAQKIIRDSEQAARRFVAHQ